MGETFDPGLKVVIHYPAPQWHYEAAQEQFFNSRNELSGIVLLQRKQQVCGQKKKLADKEYIAGVTLGDLMLDEHTKHSNALGNAYVPIGFAQNDDDVISLNRYLIANGLRSADPNDGDPRMLGSMQDLFGPLYKMGFDPNIAPPAPDGVKKVLTVGAVQ